MQYTSRIHKIILFIEGVGFLILMGIIWIDELFDLPSLLFNTQETPYNITEVIMEISIIGILGSLVLIITHCVLRQIRYLAGFYRICSACKKVFINGIWVSIEEFLHTCGEVDLTHGLCDECAKKYSTRSVDL